jgi:tetratricopeptide (TPR) repeat protein
MKYACRIWVRCAKTQTLIDERLHQPAEATRSSQTKRFIKGETEMDFLRNLFGKKHPTQASSVLADEDAAFLQAEPISRKRMDLLWLDPPRLAQLRQPIAQAAAHHKVATVTLGDSSNLRTHEITQEDFEWAKRVELIVDKAFALGQRGNYKESIHHYKKALELAPGCDLFLMSIGAGYAQLGQKAKAVRYLERAAQISPGNSRIRDNLDKARRM